MLPFKKRKVRGEEVRVAFRSGSSATCVHGLVCTTNDTSAYVWFGVDHPNNGFFAHNDLQRVGKLEPTEIEVADREIFCESQIKNVKLLKNLSDIKNYFWHPVCSRTYPDYADVITTPMCFRKILRNLVVGAYPNADVMRADVALVWANCRLYNKNNPFMIGIVDRLEPLVSKRLFSEL